MSSTTNKTNITGMYLGAILLAGALVSVIMFHFTLSNNESEEPALEIYYISDIAIHALMLPPVIIASFILAKFKFSFNRGRCQLYITC